MLGTPAAPMRQAKLQMAAVAKLPEMRRQFRAMQRQFEELRGEAPTRSTTTRTIAHDKAA